MADLYGRRYGTTDGDNVKYFEFAPMDLPSGPMRLPWPMTNGELTVYLAVLTVGVMSSFAFVLWLSFELIEPSLWRVVPAIVWAFALRGVVIPVLANALAPKDLSHRWATIERERTEEPPTGAIQ